MNMAYSEWTRQQLVDRIRELDALNQALLREQEQEVRLEFAWSGKSWSLVLGCGQQYRDIQSAQSHYARISDG